MSAQDPPVTPRWQCSRCKTGRIAGYETRRIGAYSPMDRAVGFRTAGRAYRRPRALRRAVACSTRDSLGEVHRRARPRVVTRPRELGCRRIVGAGERDPRVHHLRAEAVGIGTGAGEGARGAARRAGRTRTGSRARGTRRPSRRAQATASRTSRRTCAARAATCASAARNDGHPEEPVRFDREPEVARRRRFAARARGRE